MDDLQEWVNISKAFFPGWVYINALFGIMLYSKVSSSLCGHVSSTLEVFWTDYSA